PFCVQAQDGIRDRNVTGVQTCALPISTVMPQLHMPLQSGSDAVLRAMRRSYRSTKFLGILDRVRQAIPHAAITTDIIVGFPGEKIGSASCRARVYGSVARVDEAY